MFEQVKLDYDFDALEPYIDTLTMETHYGKHQAAYTKNFNEAAEFLWGSGLGEGKQKLRKPQIIGTDRKYWFLSEVQL